GVGGLESQCQARLELVPGFFADLAEPADGLAVEHRNERGRRLGDVLACVLVVTQRERELEPVREVRGDLAEYGPGQIVLAVGEEGQLERVRELRGTARRAVHGERLVAAADRVRTVRCRDIPV